MQSRRELDRERMFQRIAEEERRKSADRRWGFWLLMGGAVVFSMTIWASWDRPDDAVMVTVCVSALIFGALGYTQGRRVAWENAKDHYESSDPWRIWEALALPEADDRLREIAARLLRKAMLPPSVLIERESLDPSYHERYLAERKVALRRVKRLLSWSRGRGSRPAPSSESERPSGESSEAKVNAHLDEVRAAMAAEDAYRNRLRRERLAREQRAAQEEEPPSMPPED